MAIAVGLACVNAGLEARFFTAAELALSLTRANREHRLEQLMKGIAKSQLLIIDGLGHVPLDQDGARLLFQVVSDCYEKRSLIITTNIEFSKWGVVFGDGKLARRSSTASCTTEGSSSSTARASAWIAP